ncbi:hypothetical protein [Yoonia sp. 208BN28-4]|uniref:hypothetical protein n=1 Tax=Yoonia sp. 208BN28-4 TaxID=3126505 RepID=UPI003099B16E
MVILRAFPLSFSIYWRMLLVFPVIIVALIVLGGLVGLLVLILAMLLPTVIVSVLVFALCMSFMTTPLLVGMRMGLIALGHTPRNTYGGLWGFAAMYGLVMALLTTVITAIVLIVSSFLFGFAPMSPGLGGADILMALSQNSTLATGLFITINLIPFCIFAALMMPMAASSIGKDTNGERHTPFAGFGKGFIPVVVLMLVAQAVNIAAMVIIPTVFASIAGDATLMNALATMGRYRGGELPRGTGLLFAGIVLPYLVCALWTISLQCAAAVRVYADDCDATPPRPMPTPTDPDDGPVVEDIGALWRNRMPTTH